jgi:hypothetical protein
VDSLLVLGMNVYNLSNMKTKRDINNRNKDKKGTRSRPSAKPAPQEKSDVHFNKKKKKRISDELVRETILGMCENAGILSSVRPEAIAKELYPEEWQTMLKRVRLMAKQLAIAGKINILRKGKVADPEEAKGIISLQFIENDEEE